jgi:hypothetical protein
MVCEQKWECGWLWIKRASDGKWRQANEREVIGWLAGQVEALESRLSAVDGVARQQRYEGPCPDESISLHGVSQQQ